MEQREDSFPFMTDQEVTTYWEAVSIQETERNEEHHRTIRQAYNTADVLTLNILIDHLKTGCTVSQELDEKLEDLYAVTDREKMTA